MMMSPGGWRMNHLSRWRRGTGPRTAAHAVMMMLMLLMDRVVAYASSTAVVIVTVGRIVAILLRDATLQVRIRAMMMMMMMMMMVVIVRRVGEMPRGRRRRRRRTSVSAVVPDASRMHRGGNVRGEGGG